MANETQRDSTAQPTTREHSAAPTQRDTPQAPPTQHQRALVDGIRVVVPESLRERFDIQKQLPTQGAEADILVAEDRQHSRTVIIKLYRHGIQPKSEVLDKIAKMAAEHVVQLYEHGQAEDGAWFEVMEYAQYGSLRNIIKKPLPAEQAKPVLQELQTALSALHSHNIIHRDLKPENILVRELLPLDLMLTDFGIASVNVATQHMTNTSRTAKYAAPEAASGVLSAKADWWSLGMIMLEVLTGKTPFDGMSDAVITKHLINHPITPDGVTDARWQQLLLGLLNRNDAVRWNGEQVNRWLAGEDIAVTKDAETSPNAVNQGYRPYVFVGVSYATPKALASGLLLHWDEAVKHLGRDLILSWFKEEIKDQDTISFLMDLKDDRQLTVDSKLLRLVQRLDPSLPPIWKGIDVSPQGILALANAAQNDAQQRQFLWEFRHGALKQFQQSELQAFSAQLIEQEQAFELAWNTLDQAWQSSKQLDKSILKPTKPSAESVLPQLILASNTTDSSEKLRQSLLLNNYKTARQCPWFAALGDKASADYPTLLVMAACDKAAVEWYKAAQQAAEVERKIQWEKDNADLLFKQHLQQLRKLIDKKQIFWFVLISIFYLISVIVILYYMFHSERNFMDDFGSGGELFLVLFFVPLAIVNNILFIGVIFPYGHGPWGLLIWLLLFIIFYLFVFPVSIYYLLVACVMGYINVAVYSLKHFRNVDEKSIYDGHEYYSWLKISESSHDSIIKIVNKLATAEKDKKNINQSIIDCTKYSAMSGLNHGSGIHVGCIDIFFPFYITGLSSGVRYNFEFQHNFSVKVNGREMKDQIVNVVNGNSLNLRLPIGINSMLVESNWYKKALVFDVIGGKTTKYRAYISKWGPFAWGGLKFKLESEVE